MGSLSHRTSGRMLLKLTVEPLGFLCESLQKIVGCELFWGSAIFLVFTENCWQCSPQLLEISSAVFNLGFPEKVLFLFEKLMHRSGLLNPCQAIIRIFVVDMLLPSPSTSSASCTFVTRAAPATRFFDYSFSSGLLQRRSRRIASIFSGSTAACPQCCGEVCFRSTYSGSCDGNTMRLTLASGQNSNYIQTVHLDACVCVWCCAGLHPKHVDLSDWTAWSLAPSFCCIWVIRRAAHTNEIWDQIVLSCWTDSMECSATRAACNRCVFPEKPENFSFYPGLWSWLWFTLTKIKVDWPYCKAPLAMHVSGVDKCLIWIELNSRRAQRWYFDTCVQNFVISGPETAKVRWLNVFRRNLGTIGQGEKLTGDFVDRRQS